MAVATRHSQRASLQAQAVGHRGAAASGWWGSGGALPETPGQKYRLIYLSVLVEETAKRNSSLQGAYLIIAARAWTRL